MRILHVIIALAEVIGGPPRALANLARAQARRGDDVAVLPCADVPGMPTIPPGREGNLLVREAPRSRHLFWYSPQVHHALREAARDREIVHIHGTWRYHLLGAASVAREFGIPYIVRPAGNLGEACRGHKSFIKRPYFELFERRVINRAAAIHCTSDKERREVAPLRLKTRPFIVPQPVATDLLELTPDDAELAKLCPKLRPEQHALTYLGRISHLKRLDLLVDAFLRVWKEYSDWHLIIAGPHEDQNIVSDLRRRIYQARADERVSLPGMVSGAAKAALLRRTRIFAQPSRHENFGISVAEALLFGAPCVLSNGVALAEDVAAAGAGIVCSQYPVSFAFGLRRMLADADLRRKCATAALGMAHEYWPERVAERLNVEYLTCLSGRSGRVGADAVQFSGAT